MMGVIRNYQIELPSTSRDRLFVVEAEYEVAGDEVGDFKITAVTPEGGPDLGPEAVCPRTLANLAREVASSMTKAEAGHILGIADARAREEALGL